MKKEKISVKTDDEGYLYDYLEWTEKLALNLAKKESIFLTQQHWEIIYLIRKFYKKFHITPSARMLGNFIEKKIGKKKSNSRYLFKLFPLGPSQQGSKIAGLPKPNNCL